MEESFSRGSRGPNPNTSSRISWARRSLSWQGHRRAFRRGHTLDDLHHFGTHGIPIQLRNAIQIQSLDQPAVNRRLDFSQDRADLCR